MTEHRQGKKPLALVIEDDKNLNEIFARSLRNAGFETENIYDGQLALTQLETTAPAVVVLDLHLPNVMGEAVLSYIREQERLARTRVIVATANPELAKSLRSKTDIILEKPVSPQQLKLLASRLLSRNNAEKPSGTG